MFGDYVVILYSIEATGKAAHFRPRQHFKLHQLHRSVRLGPKVGQISHKLDKSRTFSDQISVHVDVVFVLTIWRGQKILSCDSLTRPLTVNTLGIKMIL